MTLRECLQAIPPDTLLLSALDNRKAAAREFLESSAYLDETGYALTQGHVDHGRRAFWIIAVGSMPAFVEVR